MVTTRRSKFESSPSPERTSSKNTGSAAKSKKRTPRRKIQGSSASVSTPSSVKSDRSAKSVKSGVDHSVRKQLALDIQFAGGIQDFDKGDGQSLARILNNPDRVDEYGPRGSPIRRQISNLVYSQWKVWDPATYLKKVIIAYQIPLEVDTTQQQAPSVASKKPTTKSARKKPPTKVVPKDVNKVEEGSIEQETLSGSEQSALTSTKEQRPSESHKSPVDHISIPTSTTLSSSVPSSVVSAPQFNTIMGDRGEIVQRKFVEQDLDADHLF